MFDVGLLLNLYAVAVKGTDIGCVIVFPLGSRLLFKLGLPVIECKIDVV
jgi:hypothetical protein